MTPANRAISWLEHIRRSTEIGGPSSTKIAYLTAVFAGLFSATVLTLAFAYVYVIHRVADAAYATAAGALWTAVLGFATSAQNRKNDADKELALGRSK